ncbi:MAG: class I SAM-dependent methyltransferase [Bacteriovoracaceae bacterium]
MKDFWNDRYKDADYAYGTEANDFLKESSQRLKPNGKILCIAEGEGRNAVFLAKMGFDVTAMDLSSEGIYKARKLAQKNNVSMTTIVSDLTTFNFGTEKWDGIISIFGHLPSIIRRPVYERAIQSLKINGLFIMEAYTPEQLELNTGGPKDLDMLLTEQIIHQELGKLRQVFLKKSRRTIHEGKFHNGESSTLQFIGQRV